MRAALGLVAFALAMAMATSVPVSAQEADGVFVRFRLEEPQEGRYHVVLAGYIHKDPWYLPRAVVPSGADKDSAKKVKAGEFTPWFDLKAHAGKRLHGRMFRAGGVAEFPNVTADFVTGAKEPRLSVVIELATAPDETKVVKRWRETFSGTLTSFLVSPQLARDADSLESAAEMTARRLAWARQASKGQAVSPKKLLVQTSFWGPQRPELNLQEAEVLRLLGFNVVGNQMPQVQAKFSFQVPGHTHNVRFDPGVTRAEIDDLMGRQAKGTKTRVASGLPFNFSDEITAGTIGKSKQGLVHFQAWLKQRGVKPAELGVQDLADVVPIETPDVLRQRQQQDKAAANRVFYYTSRFRQEATTERFRWLTESFHRHFGPGPLTSTLVADHPYFSGTGLGMGMGPNPAWGRPALAADWFDLARRRALDLAGIEDWMGLQYMYGPNFTWEGFQLMGFQAAIFRSASQGRQPIIAWITPGDETNWRLKTASALCQGAKHFFYWTYGRTATSTENYWSDLRGAYDGVATISRQLAAAENIIAPGQTRKTRLALLYSICSDLWQPFGYVHMLERRGTYLALTHNQFLVDLLTEEDIDAGRLQDYDVLYATDPCIKQSAMTSIESWVKAGGHLYGSTAAGSRNEFNEEVPGLAKVFGIAPGPTVKVQPGSYHIRGALNGMAYLDQATLTSAKHPLGVIGAKVSLKADGGQVVGTFADGSPAAVRHSFGKGQTVYFGACPGLTYIKEARFVPRELKEQWPEGPRLLINAAARQSNVLPLVQLSHPVVEAGVYDAEQGTALVLANFTYQPIADLKVSLFVPRPVKSIRSCEKGDIPFTQEPTAAGAHPPGYPHRATFTLNLGLSDIVLLK